MRSKQKLPEACQSLSDRQVKKLNELRGMAEEQVEATPVKKCKKGKDRRRRSVCVLTGVAGLTSTRDTTCAEG